MKQDKLLAAAALGICMGSLSGTPAFAASKNKADTVQCYGITKSAGENGCAISKSEIAAANEVYKNKFTKSKGTDCSGQAECAAKKGVLAWISKPSKDVCLKENGFLILKDKDGKVLIEDKGGVKNSG